MSFWFKVNAHIGTTWNYLAHLGIRGTNGDSTLVGLQNDQISITTWGDSKINSGVVATPGVWYHVTSTWPGGAFYDNAKLYINAVSYGDTANTRDEADPLSFPTSGNKLTLGKQMNTTSDYFDGSIANFRLFNRALTSDEIYQLYAYRKEYFGHGDLSMTLKAGRLGIGTSEPRAALDVRGDIHGGCPVYFYARNQSNFAGATGGATIPYNYVIVSRGGAPDSGGVFTCPLAGVYRFDYYVRNNSTTGAYLRVYVNGVFPGVDGSATHGHGDAYMYSNRQYLQVSGVFVSKLNVGDTIEIKLLNSTSVTIQGPHYNAFYGQYLSSL
jgi:hypothetical protein